VKRKTLSVRLVDLAATRRYINAIDFSLLKEKLSRPDFGLAWPEEKILRVEREYRNWLFLRRKYEPEALTPTSKDMDEFWHAHILDTKSYHTHTAKIFGSYLHHFPYFGLRGASDYQNLVIATRRTHELYLAEFGESLDAGGKAANESDVVSAKTPLICYLKINKNASSSVRSVLRHFYGEDEYKEITIWGRHATDGQPVSLESPDDEVITAIETAREGEMSWRCLTTNLPFGLHRKLRREVAYFTLLREPVARCISWWCFAYANRKSSPAWSRLERYDFSLPKIFEAHAFYELSNDQVRMITGTGQREVTKDTFHLACELIEESYAFVGTVELFNRSMSALGRRFGWHGDFSIRENAGRKHIKILPKMARFLFSEANEWDIRLYEWLTKNYLPRHL